MKKVETIKKIVYRLREYMLFSNEKKLDYSRSIGVKIGKNSRMMDLPFLGSEPWLIEIGDHVTVSDHVTFLTHDGGTYVFRDRPEYKDVIKYGRIIIEDNCFVGSHTIIMPNVRIGSGSVIGAGSVVTRSVPKNEVWAGNPAHFICNVGDYAEKCKNNTPVYDKERYLSDKKAELQRILPYPE